MLSNRLGVVCSRIKRGQQREEERDDAIKLYVVMHTVAYQNDERLSFGPSSRSMSFCTMVIFGADMVSFLSSDSCQES